MPTDGVTDDQLRAGMEMMATAFRDLAPLTAAAAATQILDAVREERWRVLVGKDAEALDRRVREAPEEAYEQSFVDKLRQDGFLGALIGTISGRND